MRGLRGLGRWGVEGRRPTFRVSFLAGLVAFVLLPCIASAQSTISGVASGERRCAPSRPCPPNMACKSESRLIRCTMAELFM